MIVNAGLMKIMNNDAFNARLAILDGGGLWIAHQRLLAIALRGHGFTEASTLLPMVVKWSESRPINVNDGGLPVFGRGFKLVQADQDRILIRWGLIV